MSGRRWTEQRSWRRALATLAATLLVVLQPLGAASARAATPTSIEILDAPASPIVANSDQLFTAQIDPFASGRTVSWYVNGGLAATDLTNPNGVSGVHLSFGAGGYLIQAVLEPGVDWDRAQSDAILVMVTQDPAKAPDKFSLSSLGHATIGTSGDDAHISVDRAGLSPSTLEITADNAMTGDTLRLRLAGPEGLTLAPGAYPNADSPRPRTQDAELHISGSWAGCGSPSKASFDILSLERDPAGVPISFAITFEFRCQGEAWPTLGWIRYNATTAIRSLSLPDAFPVFDSVVEGQAGTAKTFPVTNDGDSPVTLGQISMTESTGFWVTPFSQAPADFVVSADGCSGATLAPGDACSFDLRFAPAVSGARGATILMPWDAPLSPRRLDVIGQGLIAMAVGAPVVRADSQWFSPGVRYEATVTPNPEVNFTECLVDGVHLDGSIPDRNGLAFCVAPRPDPGTHAIRVHYLGSVFHGPAWSPTTSFTVDPTTTTGLVASKTTAPSNVPVTITATVAFAGDVSYPGGTVTITDTTTNEVVAQGTVGPDAPSLAVTRTFAAGSHHLVAEYGGVAGAEDPSSGSVDLSIGAPDLTPPTASAPAWSLVKGAALSTGRLPVRIRWAGADVGSGVDHYVFRQSTDGGAWTTISTTYTSTVLDRLLLSGHTYRFQVRAVDKATNAGSWAYGSTFTLSEIQQTNRAVHYHGRWASSTSTAWWGGTAKWSSTAGSTASCTFTGRSIAWVGPKGPSRGRAGVYVDGVLRATVDLYSATTLSKRILWSADYATSATRTITIKVLGTAGRPRIDLDGFIVVR